MAEAHRRVKNPEQVRERLIETARELALDHGLSAIPISAVAEGAGVTKGGLLHHFPTKNALIDAVFAHMLAELEAKLEGLMTADRRSEGRFTRAYVEAAFDADETRWGPIWMTTLTDAGLREKWNTWFSGMIRQHGEDDGRLDVARMAADGVWLASLVGSPPRNLDALKALIFSMTGLID